MPKSTWLVRDFIAHLGTIDRSVVNWFRAIQQGHSGRPATSSGERFDVDRWNDAQVAERRDWTLDRVFDEMAANRAEIRDVIASFTEDDLNRTISFGGDSKRAASEITLIQYLRGWCKHDVMHAYDMARALPGRITPEIERWFDDPAVVGYQKSMNGDD